MTRGRAREATVLVLVALVGAAALLWGADTLARRAAEALLVEEVQQATGVGSRPEVRVGGGPFLLQALRGRFDSVQITVRGLSNGPLVIGSTTAELSGVRVPLHDLLLQEVDAVVVDAAVQEARLDYADLDRYLRFTGRPFRVAPAGDGQVRLSGTVQALGGSYDVAARARLGAEAGALVIEPTAVETGASPEGTELLLAERLSILVPLDPLPFGQTVTAVQPEEEALVVRTAAEGVLLRP
ncbi:LmeA family phospholipid-binding protein [Geodermatophilus marinus]|uniref:LmeA family phospholipid-binding protein n=1 Tax=Geodermatophilus sp. LHW52908 TaxID=2303986 RepID=UPI001314ED60|nr:DUF2993 domain-containing protein [Geodermatophilus sp. LHW52908]